MVREGRLNKATVEHTCHPCLSSASGEGSAIQPANDGRSHGTEAEVTASKTGTVPVLVKPRSPACVLRRFRRVYPRGAGWERQSEKDLETKTLLLSSKSVAGLPAEREPRPHLPPTF